MVLTGAGPTILMGTLYRDKMRCIKMYVNIYIYIFIIIYIYYIKYINYIILYYIKFYYIILYHVIFILQYIILCYIIYYIYRIAGIKCTNTTLQFTNLLGY